eukprot:CAMPEP_0197193942 /NCGR_PEP_ID=MMETSP1423-20130617/28298_1 /TAXON_ID=476441 /ORGANISM="Pseudo-nitzschia heimii, Strain UNC1101" /LENGTH=151 /DNA_ID=CAMNT_0042647269 /DNA_START=189 /DNA_END=647 /DNA_ORIENTATION=-
MNINDSNKTVRTFHRTRYQQDPYSPTPLNVEDDAETSIIQKPFKRSALDDINYSEQFDLYSPLAYEEADEDQLAELFQTLDIDFSFGGCDTYIKNMSKVSKSADRHTTKRRRLSNSADSYSSSFSDDTDDYDGAELQRKQDRFGRENSPVE